MEVWTGQGEGGEPEETGPKHIEGNEEVDKPRSRSLASRLVRKWGVVVGRRPLTVIAGVLVVFGVMCIGYKDATIAESTREKWKLDIFKFSARNEGRLKSTLGVSHARSSLRVTARLESVESSDLTSPLEPSVIRGLWSVLGNVSNIDGIKESCEWDSLRNACAMHSILRLWLSREEFNAEGFETGEDVLARIKENRTTPEGEELRLVEVCPNPLYNPRTGELEGCERVSLIIVMERMPTVLIARDFDAIASDFKEEHEQLGDLVIQHQPAIEGEAGDDSFADQVVDDEGPATWRWAVMYAVALVFLDVYKVLRNGKQGIARELPTVGVLPLVALLSIGAATISAVGVTMWAGVPLYNRLSFLPLVVLGLGIDGGGMITESMLKLSDASPSAAVEQHAADTSEGVVQSIAIAACADSLGLLIDALDPLAPEGRVSMNIYTLVTVIFLFVILMSGFFAAAVVLVRFRLRDTAHNDQTAAMAPDSKSNGGADAIDVGSQQEKASQEKGEDAVAGFVATVASHLLFRKRGVKIALVALVLAAHGVLAGMWTLGSQPEPEQGQEASPASLLFCFNQTDSGKVGVQARMQDVFCEFFSEDFVDTSVYRGIPSEFLQPDKACRKNSMTSIATNMTNQRLCTVEFPSQCPEGELEAMNKSAMRVAPGQQFHEQLARNMLPTSPLQLKLDGDDKVVAFCLDVSTVPLGGGGELSLSEATNRIASAEESAQNLFTKTTNSNGEEAIFVWGPSEPPSIDRYFKRMLIVIAAAMFGVPLVILRSITGAFMCFVPVLLTFHAMAAIVLAEGMQQALLPPTIMSALLAGASIAVEYSVHSTSAMMGFDKSAEERLQEASSAFAVLAISSLPGELLGTIALTAGTGGFTDTSKLIIAAIGLGAFHGLLFVPALVSLLPARVFRV